MRFYTLLAVASLAVAQADILHLHNGRSLEGQVIRRTPTQIHLKMNHGRMVVRVDQVREIERRLRPELELAERYRLIDPSNPAELERLSLWASRRGLGRESSDLGDHARGIRLDRRLEAISGSRVVSDWLDVYTWARVNGVSDTVQEHLLQTARGIDPNDQALLALVAARQEEARAESRRQAEIERRRNEPIFKMPGNDRKGFAHRSQLIPVVDEIGREGSKSERLVRIASGSGLRANPARAEDGVAKGGGAEDESSTVGDPARIRELEQQVSEQDARVAEQQAELDRLRSRSRVRRRVARRPGAPGLIVARPKPVPATPPAKPKLKPTVLR